jgi:predicted MarR family transcription regulator
MFPYFNPTVRDLCALTDIHSTSQVASVLDELEKRNLIQQRMPGKSRSIVLRESVQ